MQTFLCNRYLVFVSKRKTQLFTSITKICSAKLPVTLSHLIICRTLAIIYVTRFKFKEFNTNFPHSTCVLSVKVKVIPSQAAVALKVPGRLRPRIFLTFGTTRVIGRQPYAPAAFTPGKIPGTHFQRLS